MTKLCKIIKNSKRVLPVNTLEQVVLFPDLKAPGNIFLR